MNRKIKQKLLERKFDQQLKSAIVEMTLAAKRKVLFEKDEESDDIDKMIDDLESDKDTDEEDTDEEDTDTSEEDVDTDEEDTDEEDTDEFTPKRSGRGGPQIAKAAYRDEPPPDADDLDIDMLTKKLNAIRSGKSLSDDDTHSRVEEYFASLTKNQRLALYAFLEGLAEVIAAEIDGDEARAPDDPEYKVDIKVRQGEQDAENATVRPLEKRVAKPGAKEYNVDKRRVASVGSKPQQRKTNIDASDDAPVMVVK
jgi:hypothetical protein